jgi:hypothetical protein
VRLEDELSGLSADLVGEARHVPFLRELLTLAPGRLYDAIPLVAALPEARDGLGAVERAAGDRLRVTWIENDGSAYGPEYVVVLFYLEAIHWHNVAVVNRRTVGA